MSPADEAFRTFRSSGDPGALARVFDAVAPELLMVAVHIAPDGVQAEDLLQSTFLAAIEGAQGFDPEQRLMPWLVGILVNQARRERRDRGRRLQPDRLEPRPEVGPVEAAEAQEFAAAIGAAMASLPQPYREVVTLSFVHGLSPKAIAHALGRPAGTVKAQLHRGREILRRALPAGFAAAALGWLGAGRGLAAVRRQVLDRAARRQTPPPRPGRGAAATKIAATAFVVIGAALLAWWAFGGAGASAPPALPDTAAAAPPATDDAATTDRGAGSAAPARFPVAAPAPSPRRGPASVRVAVRWHDGAPAPGVMVSLLPERRANAWLHQRWLRTDADGRAVAAHWPAGPLLVHGDRGGETRALVEPGRAHDVELTLPRGVAVTGTVVDHRFAPLAGATVTVSRRGVFDDHVGVTTADAAGNFTLRDVEPGRCLGAVAAGHEPTGIEQVDGVAGGSATVALRASNAGGTLEGTVTTLDGAPVASAKVMVGLRLGTELPKGVPPVMLTTDDAGRFVTHSAPINPDPQVELWVRAPGFGSWARQVPVGTGAIAVVLEPEARVVGRVTDRAGRPVTDPRVELRDEEHHRSDIGMHPPAWGRLTARTDVRGAFALGGATGLRHHASAIAADGRRSSAMLELAAGATTVWNPVVAPPLRITGVVRDEAGTPLRGWRVTLQPPPTFDLIAAALTDAQGRFVFEGCERCPYTLRCRAAASPWPGVMGERRDVRIEDAPLSVVVPRRAMPTCRLHGTVHDTTGKADKLLIGVIGAHLLRWFADVDPATGAFAIGPVPPGEHVLYVYGGDRMVAFSGPHELAAGDSLDLGSIDILPNGTLRARFVDAAGRPLRGVHARICQPDGRGSAVAGPPDGLLRSRLPPGRYYVDVQDHVGPDGWTAADVVAGRRTDVVHTLPVTQPQHFLLQHPEDGKTLQVSWSWFDRGGRLLSRDHIVRRRNDGSAVEMVRHLAPGTYRAELRSHAGLVASAVVTAPAPAGAPPTLLAMAPPATPPQPTDPEPGSSTTEIR